MDLSEGFDIDSAEEHDHASDTQQSGCQKLYVKLVFRHGVFFKSGAKVQQKNEGSKKIPEQVRFTRGDCSTFSNRRGNGYRFIKSQVILRVLRKEEYISGCELFGTNKIRSVIHFAKAFEEPSELVIIEFFSDGGTEPLIKYCFGCHKPRSVLNCKTSLALYRWSRSTRREDAKKHASLRATLSS